MTGYDFFGLNHPTIVRMIEDLPNVRFCTNYQFDFDWAKLRFAKSILPNYQGINTFEEKGEKKEG